MCGRARCTVRADDIPRACYRAGASVRHVNINRYSPSYNVSPGFNLPVLRRDDQTGGGEGVVVHCMKWGLVPGFSKKNEKPDFYRMFNARSESISEKASFRRLLPKNRCLVVVEGFYEWKKDGSKKQPYYIHFKDDKPLVFAALYDSWESSEGEVLDSFTIITTSSSPALQWLHDRMPVILGDKESVDLWLDGASVSKFNTVLKPNEDPDLVWYAVTPAMGKPSFTGPECVKELKMTGISKFFSIKETKEEELSRKNKGFPNKSIKTEPLSDFKKEAQTDEDRETDNSMTKDSSQISLSELPTFVKTEPQTEGRTETGDLDSIFDISKPKDSDSAKFQIKRDYEEFKAESNTSTDNIKKLDKTPPKKKQNVKTTNNQPTLLSYFGKK